MSFPSSPVNNQVATVNGIIYTYNSTKSAWIRTGTSSQANLNLIVNTLTVSSSNPSTSTVSGALTVAGGVGIQGSLYVGGDISGNLNIGGITPTFETLSKNLAAYPYTINRSGTNITSIVYATGEVTTITKAFTYGNNLVSSIAIYGDTLANVYTKNLTYVGTTITGATYSKL